MRADPGVIVRVECAQGQGGEEVPRLFFLGDRRIAIVAVLDCWPGMDHRYFKVRGNDGALYILRHDMPSGEWEIILFEQR
ncbi:hypothetical protein ACO9S2_01210 [Nitrospira sp. NS4]|uniref:hypothetical protein n=1 Tax=Nitrospira sp. NS4 TaxID=3414498 RepID=UPI003C2DF674